MGEYVWPLGDCMSLVELENTTGRWVSGCGGAGHDGGISWNVQGWLFIAGLHVHSLSDALLFIAGAS